MRKFVYALAVVACCLAASAQADAAEGDPGQTVEVAVPSGGSEYRYLLYTPTSYSKRDPAPLVVVVHGCQTSAEQEQAVTEYDALAEREGFLVAYVDVDAAGRALPGPLKNCWKFFDPTAYTRGSSDSAAIVAMTEAVIDQRSVDPERVYLAGISAGGLMTSINAALYPDVYAAVAIMSSAGYNDAPCFTTGTGIPASTSAQLAFLQMGERARVMPTFVLGGDADLAFPWSCTSKALEQALRTDNLVLSGSQEGPIALEPADVRTDQVLGGRTSTVRTYRDPQGCLVGEGWQVHEMGHFWSGGTEDPKFAGYTDATGPSAAEATWAFFERFRHSETGLPCAESTACPEAKRKLAKAKRKVRKLRRADASRQRIGKAKKRLRSARASVAELC